MKPKDFKKIIEKLHKGGFDTDENMGSHQNYGLYKNGVLILWFKRSHSLKDYQKILIARNLHMSETDLNQFIKCSLSVDGYIDVLKKKSIWPTNLE